MSGILLFPLGLLLGYLVALRQLQNQVIRGTIRAILETGWHDQIELQAVLTDYGIRITRLRMLVQVHRLMQKGIIVRSEKRGTLPAYTVSLAERMAK